MKINENILSIPPYISTTWEHVCSLKVVDGTFTITLIDDSQVQVPDLSDEEIKKSFESHVAHVEKYESALAESKQQDSSYPSSPLNQGPGLLGSEQAIGFPIRFGSGGLEGLGASMQHNPAQKDMPDLPTEILKKVAAVAKALGTDENLSLPSPEPHCNCLHCQIARAVQKGVTGEDVLSPEEEEVVTEEDLSFREWDISQDDEKLYTVSNPLDSDEKYSVYLGSPIGCTCGHKNCEHIKAVLNS